MDNFIGTEKVGKLLWKFALPSVISMMVSALYNIVDQLFIGNKIGDLGNAATNIAFPLSISCISIALLFGVGGAASFNLAMGQKDTQRAPYYAGNTMTMLVLLGVILALITKLTLKPMLVFFGSPDNVLPLAVDYTNITAIGFPFLIFATGGGHIVRADGSPRMAMVCNMAGAIVNTVLDALFVFGFEWGMKGAALATVIGQAVSAIIVLSYLNKFKSVKLSLSHFKLKAGIVGRITSLGIAPCFNQLAMMIVQIIMNKSLKHYGALSNYGESIPIACAGIISKVNMIFMAFIIGISQGLQPIVSFNYGAGNYKRVKEAYRLTVKVGAVMAVAAFVIFQVFPRKIISLFGNGSDMYFKFAISYFRVFLLFTFLNFLQPIASNVFTAIGKPIKGVFLSLIRQILLFIPLILILPLFFGIDGILYSGPVADITAFIMCAIMLRIEFSRKEFN